MAEKPQGYSGPLPNYYIQSSAPQTPNLGLTISGVDPIVAYNFVLIDNFAAGGGGGTPGGANGDIQFNNSGAFGGSATTITAAGSITQPAGQYFLTQGVISAGNTAVAPTVPPAAGANSGWIQVHATETRVGTILEGASVNYTVIPASDNASTEYIASAVSLNVDPTSTHSMGAAQALTIGLNNYGSGAGGVMSGFVIGAFNLGSGTALMQGFEVDAAGVGTGVTSAVIGGLFTTGNTSGVGIVSNNMSIKVNTPFQGGLLTHNYGIYIADQTVGGANNPDPWGIYVVAGKSHFGSPIDVGVAGTTNGTIGLANGGGSGAVVTIQNLGATTGYNFNLPTTPGTTGQVLTSQGGGSTSMTWSTAGAGSVTSVALATGAGAADALYTISGSPITTSGTLTETLNTQTANTVFAGPTSGGAATPTFRALVAADIPAGVVLWNMIGNASGALTLANAGNATTFNQTSAVNWTWANTTAATSGTSQSSPILIVAGKYWTGAASATDSWSIQDVVANGTNGTSTLTFSQSGSTGNATVKFGTVVQVGSNPGAATFGALYLGSLTPSSTNYAMESDGTTLALHAATGIDFLIGATQIFTLTNPSGIPNLFLGSSSSDTTPKFFSGQITANTFMASPFYEGLAPNPAYVQTSTNATHGWTLFNNGAVTLVPFSVQGAASQSANLQEWQNSSSVVLTAIGSTGLVSKYNSVATVSAGIPSEIVTVDLTAQSAAITATNLIASAPQTGMYRISWSAAITTAASVSSTLGGTNGFQVGFTSPTDSVAKLTVPGNSITSAANTTATADGNAIVIYAKTGTAITYQFDYTSSGTAMVYEIHIKLESL